MYFPFEFEDTQNLVIFNVKVVFGERELLAEKNGKRITFWGRHEESIWLKVMLTPVCPLLFNACLAEILLNLRIL